MGSCEQCVVQKGQVQDHVSGLGSPENKHRLSGEWTEGSPAEKDFWLLVDAKLSMSQQCALAI